ncbi:XFP domain-containing protein [Colletotrichum musicola]|uniref:XFP domain-containing protein n=1 Tax=Colletotrichum musicola TaxID=2175873 RepID=A0A8H6NMV6_9PEZI|nr:XFP domain-containing protein [Colletotrichum musicola]
MQSTNEINLVIGAKQPMPAYFDKRGAGQTTGHPGLYTWLLSPTHRDVDPDVVLVGIGVEMMFEVRVVNVVDLTAICPKGKHPSAMSDKTFKSYFTETKHLSFSYPGKAEDLQDLLVSRRTNAHKHKITVMGYSKENPLGTPFGHMLLNSVSRFDVAIQALRAGTEITSTRLKKRSLRGNIKEVERRKTEVND